MQVTLGQPRFCFLLQRHEAGAPPAAQGRWGRRDRTQAVGGVAHGLQGCHLLSPCSHRRGSRGTWRGRVFGSHQKSASGSSKAPFFPVLLLPAVLLCRTCTQARVHTPPTRRPLQHAPPGTALFQMAPRGCGSKSTVERNVHSSLSVMKAERGCWTQGGSRGDRPGRAEPEPRRGSAAALLRPWALPSSLHTHALTCTLTHTHTHTPPHIQHSHTLMHLHILTHSYSVSYTHTHMRYT